MSVTAVAWARAQLEVNAGMRWTLYELADHADPYGRGAWPSVGRIVARTGQAERAVRAHLKALEAGGYIVRGDQTIIPSKVKGNNRPTVWDLNLGRGTRMDLRGVQNMHPSEGVQISHPNPSRGAENVAVGVQNLHPNQELKPTTNSTLENQVQTARATNVGPAFVAGINDNARALARAAVEAAQRKAKERAR